MRGAAFYGIGLAVLASAGAASAAPLQPTSPWNVNYTATSCDAKRRFGDVALVITPAPLGETMRALAHLGESLALQREIGNREGVIEVVEGAACVAASAGDARRAVVLATAAARARVVHETPPDSGFQAELDGRIAEAVARLGPGEADAARAEGGQMSLDEAAAYAVR